MKRVALFTRAWIEIDMGAWYDIVLKVALFTRAWIEIEMAALDAVPCIVALFTRAWIEIKKDYNLVGVNNCRPLHEGVD